MTNILVFDFEVFPKEWLLVYADMSKRKIEHIRNDPDKLRQVYKEQIDDGIWVGYNCRSYDQYIFKSIMLDFNPYDVSHWIIAEGNPGWKFCDEFGKIPLIFFDLMFDRNRSLKQLEGFMGIDIEECDIPWDLDRELTDEEFKTVLHYCIHDVESTCEVLFNNMANFRSYIKLISHFGMPKKSFCKTKAQLTSKILGAVQKEHDDEWDIVFDPSIRPGRYECVRDWFLDPANHNEEASMNIMAGRIDTTIAWGGAHSGIKCFDYSGLLVLADFNAFYPGIMIMFNLLSRNCNSIGKAKFKEIRDGRIIHKKTDKDLAQAEKVVINGAYGAMGDKHNALYDPRNMRNVCANGQLTILDLIDKLEDKFTLIQTNTDGILMAVDPDKLDEFKAICHKLEERTGLTLEFDYYDRIIQKDVNNYILCRDGKPVERKGGWVKECSPLDNDIPILRDGLVECLVYGKSPRDIVAEHTQLIDYQKIVKIGGMYDHCEHNGKVYHNKVYRVFASTDTEDGSLMKIKKGKDNPEKVGNTPIHCYIDNGNVKNKPITDRLDKQWYIDALTERINTFRGVA